MSTPADENAQRVARRLTVTLAGWGAVSVVGGLALARASAGQPGRRAFGQQTAAWGAINLAIAGFSAARSSRPADGVRLRRILLVNAALDVGYIAAGGHVAFHQSTFGGRVDPVASRGHGSAVVIQGAGLLALDLTHARQLS